jgi:hypothetical protein
MSPSGFASGMLSASSSSAEAKDDTLRLITLPKKPCFHPGCLQQQAIDMTAGSS